MPTTLWAARIGKHLHETDAQLPRQQDGMKDLPEYVAEPAILHQPDGRDPSIEIFPSALDSVEVSP